MNKFLLIITTAIISLCNLQAFAIVVDDKTTFPATNWTSKNATEEVTINNSSGVPMMVVINVNTGSAGATIKNCGNTTHINAGSTAICTSVDTTNPVTISSDSPTNSTSGSYQLKQP